MEITTHKEVTHTITMTQEQLVLLVEVLDNYKREILDRMPDGYGANTDFVNMFSLLQAAKKAGSH